MSLTVAGAGAAAPPSPRYQLTDLGTLGGNASFGLGLNNRAQVVGTARTSQAPRPQLAFRWERGEMTNLGSLPGSTFSRAFEINERGVAVGEAFTAAPERSRAVLWIDTTIQDLGALPGATGAVANDINNRNQVAGTSGGRAFLWERGRFTDLGAISEAPGASSRGNAVNDRGQAVGSAQTEYRTPYGTRQSHAYLWERGRMTDLGALGSPEHYSVAYAVNNRAQVVGESVVASRGTTDVYHAFVWERGRLSDLGTLPSAPELLHSRATDINNSGAIVGHVSGFYGFPTINGRAVLWRCSEALDLNALLPPGSGWVLRTAEGVNERGQIVGHGTYRGETRAFLLTPVSRGAVGPGACGRGLGE
jgi:probable HAF family extracellular repeat protein